MAQLQMVLKNFWEFLREASGENDYARYHAHALARGEQPLPPKDYYLRKLGWKYSRPARCC